MHCTNPCIDGAPPGDAGMCATAQELLSQHRALQSLVARNRDAPVEAVQAAAAECGGPTPLQLPFIIIQVP